jgi:hypothetical protein
MALTSAVSCRTWSFGAVPFHRLNDWLGDKTARTAKNEPNRWQPGQSGNPTGRPIGSRAKIAETIIRDITAEWERSGAAVMQRMAIEEPSKSAQLAAGLIPREALLTVAQRLPNNLDADDWQIVMAVMEAVRTALPDAARRARFWNSS